MLRFIQLLFLLLTCCTSYSQVKFSKEVLLSPVENAQFFDMAFQAREVGHYIPDSTAQFVIENGYACAFLPEYNRPQWPQNAIPDTIAVVFSLYPQNPEFWLTNYHILLARRLRELFKAYPQFNSNQIVWHIILQTDCTTEPETIALFHGFSVSYHFEEKQDKEPKPVTLQPRTALPILPKIPGYSLAKKVETFIYQNGGYADTSVFHMLNRNAPRWDSALVVLDWTGSMYTHGAQTLLYHILYRENLNIQAFVFFNDGNKTDNDNKTIGKTGGIYFLDGDSEKIEEQALKMFRKVQRKGDGGDREENDFEALIKAINLDKEYKELILIGDNTACVRDFILLEQINVPVHILLPGDIQGINHQYINLAYKTKGSIHTLEEDVFDFENELSDAEFQFKDYNYVLNPFGFYQCTAPYAHKFCNAFYGIERYGLKSRTWWEEQQGSQSKR